MRRIGLFAWAAGGLAGAMFAASARAGAPGGSDPASSAASPGPASSEASNRAANSSAGGAKVIEGRVEKVDRSNTLTVAGSESSGLAFQPLKVDRNTVVTKGGERVTLYDIQEGDEVRASIDGSGPNVHVRRIEILPAPKPAPGTK